MPEYANYHVDKFLTNYSLAWKNESYMADEVFPVVPVDKASDKYVIYQKDAFLRGSGLDSQGKSDLIRRPGTRSTEITYELSNNPFFCEEIAKSYILTMREVNGSDKPLRPSVTATEVVTEIVKLGNEISVAKKSMKRANYASGNKSQLVTNTTSWAANAAPYATAQTSFPISVDLPNAKKAVMLGLLRAPNRIVMDYSAATVLAANWEYKDKFRGVSTESLTSGGIVPMLLGLETKVAPTQYVTSLEGAPITTNYAWQDDQGQDAALVYYAPPNVAGLETLSFGLTFEAPDDMLGTRGFSILRWLEPWRKAEVIECATLRDWRFTATDGSASGDNGSGFATGGALISGVTL